MYRKEMGVEKSENLQAVGQEDKEECLRETAAQSEWINLTAKKK